MVRCGHRIVEGKRGARWSSGLQAPKVPERRPDSERLSLEVVSYREHDVGRVVSDRAAGIFPRRPPGSPARTDAHITAQAKHSEAWISPSGKS